MEVIAASVTSLIARWAHLYGDQKALSAGVTYAHLAGVLLGGGMAIAADRASVRLAPADAAEVRRELARLATVHNLVLGGLAVTAVSGVLMMLSDLHTYLTSVLFWVKMGMIAILLANGWVRLRAETALAKGGDAWRTFRLTSAFSLALWFAILLAGAYLTTIA